MFRLKVMVRYIGLVMIAQWVISMYGCTSVDHQRGGESEGPGSSMDQGLLTATDAGRGASPGDRGVRVSAPDMMEPGLTADMSMPQRAQPQLFIIAGQSNAEGNAFYTGLELLASQLPEGDQPLSPADRASARELIARSQGGWCSPADVRERTADVVIDHLRSTTLDWRNLDLDYAHPAVRIRARQYNYAPVTIQDASGAEVARCDDCDNPMCDLSPEDGSLAGPVMTMYTEDRLMPLAVGFGIAEDPEEGKSYGPELAFGHALGRTHPNSIIFKMAMGGSSLGDHWRIDGPMYAAFIEGVNTALADHDATLGGFVWFQGFNDQFESAYCDPLTPAYQVNLQAFLEAVRRDLGEPVPTVIVKARNGGNLDSIQNAQDAVAARLDHAVTVETSDTSECFHYDSGAQIVIGERVADAMVTLLAP